MSPSHQSQLLDCLGAQSKDVKWINRSLFMKHPESNNLRAASELCGATVVQIGSGKMRGGAWS